MTIVSLASTGPYSLELSLRAAESFAPAGSSPPHETPEVLRSAVRLDGEAAILEVRQVNDEPARLEAEVRTLGSGPSGRPGPPPETVADAASRLVNAALDLRPFYRLAAGHSLLGPLTGALHGLKAFRPQTLFEMLVIAVIEQQISLLAAYHIRERIVHRFGDAIDGLTVFPTPESLAQAPAQELAECGVSRRKAEYIGGLAELVTAGALDLGSWEQLSDDEIRDRVTAVRGFGRWSADYLLIRGLGRPDVAPADDLGIQTLLGRILGDGRRLSPDEVRSALAPFAPFRGLAVFYILAGSRLSLI